jgi:hypothetical protein
MHYDVHIHALIDDATDRISRIIAADLPLSAASLQGWTRHLAGSDAPADYFRHPHAFPMLLLPHWLEQTITADPDPTLQADLVFSTMCGYYYIRMIDNVMDGHATIDQQILPALGVFHTHFMAPYFGYFAAGHPFWDDFRRIWSHAADCTIADGQATTIDLAHFERISGQKVAGGIIPLAAVCQRYGRGELLPAWRELFERLGCWHQLFNDLFSWRKDLAAGTLTLVLCEAERRKRPGESAPEWMIREGFDWVCGLLEEWLELLAGMAGRLGSAPLIAYLETRSTLLAAQAASVRNGFRALNSLASLIQSPAKGE